MPKKLNWISLLFFKLTQLSSHSQQRFWQFLYNQMAKRDTSGQFIFMNYGYHPAADLPPLTLHATDEPFRYFIQLYDRIVQDVTLEGKDVVEVGCGRGGGGSFVIRYHNPQTYTGIDLSDKAITWCRQTFPFKNAQWLTGAADALPLNNNSTDVVLNVESSHCYPSMQKFLSEVNRILRPGGYFAFCDLRHTSAIDKLDKTLKTSGLNLIQQQDITPQVLQALDRVSTARDAQINAVFPFFLRSAIRDFAAVKNTAVYNMLKTKDMQYVTYLLQAE